MSASYKNKYLGIQVENIPFSYSKFHLLGYLGAIWLPNFPERLIAITCTQVEESLNVFR